MGLLFILAKFFYIQAPDVEMRREPDPQSEVASHAYFSEQINVLEESGEWTRIKTLVDEVKGWVKGKPFCALETPYPSQGQTIQINRCAAHVYHVKDTIYGPILTLPFESQLEVINKDVDSEGRWMKVRLPWGREAYIQQGDVTVRSLPLNRQEMCTLSHLFLGLPYTWGGRTSFGYDCSGFTQMLYRQMGVHLPRNSGNQCRWSRFSSVKLEHLASGDLIFFGKSAREIQHVGLYLGNDRFIHAAVSEKSPYIHISTLSDPEWSGKGHFPYRTFRTLNAPHFESNRN